MGEEITLAMIKEAMELIKEADPEKIVFEDDYQTIWGNGLGPTKFQLKPKGKGIIDNYIKQCEAYN